MLISAGKKCIRPLLSINNHQKLREYSSIPFFHVGIFFSEKHFTSVNCWWQLKAGGCAAEAEVPHMVPSFISLLDIALPATLSGDFP